MTKSEQRQFGRAKNAVLSFLEKKLSVPRIYMDAEWAGHHVDILAIDRDGVGDVHAALFFARPYEPQGQLSTTLEGRAINDILTKFEVIPAQFKYVVAVEVDTLRGSAPLRLADMLLDKSYAPDGIGRVGVILVDFLLEGEPEARMHTKPERFRAKIAALADEYVAQHTADWELRA